MRIFQNFGFYGEYQRRLGEKYRHSLSYNERRQILLADRYSASHVLLPAYNGDPKFMFTVGNDCLLQRTWAKENGLPAKSSLEDILLAQIEAHRTEVFYNIDPIRYDDKFVKKLPSCVKLKIAWRAAPSGGALMKKYDCIVCNFPNILRSFELKGQKSEYFAPSHDPVMESYAHNQNRPVDIVFIGSYSRHHAKRNAILNHLAEMGGSFCVKYYLKKCKLTQISESYLGKFLPLSQWRRSEKTKLISFDSIYGLDLYYALSRAKIVLNASIDIAEDYRGNMRCWEAMGCGAVMLSEAGKYPPGMEAGLHFEIFQHGDDIVAKANQMLADKYKLQRMAEAAYKLISENYSKEKQWESFQKIISKI